MDDFANILHRDYGLKPQGKSAPMSAVRSGPIPPAIGKNSSTTTAGNVSGWGSTSAFPDDDLFSGVNGIKPSSSSGRHTFGSVSGADLLAGSYKDAFGSPSKFTPSAASDFFDDAFKTSSSVPSNRATVPAHDTPVYDDDIFGGLPGINGTGSVHDDIFNLVGSNVSAAKESSDYDKLFGDFSASNRKTTKDTTDLPSATEDFEELLPGFGKAEPVKSRSSGDTKSAQEKYAKSVNKPTASLTEDSFSLFGQDTASSSGVTTPVSNLDPFVVPDALSRETSRKNPSNGSGSNNRLFEDNTHADNLHPTPEQQFDTVKRYMSKGSKSSTPPSPGMVSESTGSTDANDVPANPHNESITKDHRNTHHRSSTVNSGESRTGGNSHRSGYVRRSDAPKNGQSKESVAFPSKSRGMEFLKSNSSRVDEYWISVEDIKLVTKPSTILPPSRSPPMPGSKQTIASEKSSSWRKGVNQDKPWENGHSSSDPSGRENANRNMRILDEFEEFAHGGAKLSNGAMPPLDVEQVEGSAAATASGAAVKKAIEKAEAKLRQAKEAKNKDKGVQSREDRLNEELERQQREAKAMRDKEEKERREKEREARERHRRERAREKEMEKERERERQKDRANETSQQRNISVEGANVDVRTREPQKGAERSAGEARAKAKAERQAVERVMAEARERHDRAAVERAKATEKERAATSAHQGRAEDDIESFFMSSTRPTSAPKQRSHATDLFSQRQQTNDGQRSPSTASNVKKVPSMPTMVDDLSSLFGGPPAPGEFQEVEGEPDDRRKARWERHQRTLERAAKALDEKRQRDLQSEREQAERHRAGELVDAEIKRWAAGKEGNLRALLSSLHYVLWPECGWQPVTLTELITAAAVKKVYKKATLCVHPDKVQQKGATIHQKYVAEKVFDLLKEAWNKFNSEELF